MDRGYGVTVRDFSRALAPLVSMVVVLGVPAGVIAGILGEWCGVHGVGF